MTTVYKLTAVAHPVPWKHWKKMGGCGLSHFTEITVGRALGPSWMKEACLGEIAHASVVASREIANFAVNHLHLDSWAEVEYRFEDHTLKVKTYANH